MSILGVDIGSSTTKIIEYKNERIENKIILREGFSKEKLDNFILENNINVEKIVFTGIGASKVDKEVFLVPINFVDEFTAIAKGGLYLAKKEEALVASVGTGTAFIEVNKECAKHLGGTGVGAGTLFNICKRMLDINSFDEIENLAKVGDVEKIDLRIKDITNEEIPTLPLDLTLSNFGKFEENSKNGDIVIGLINMIFEVIGMMAVFIISKNDIKDVILIGNITVLPGVKYVLDRIEKVQNIKFIVPENSEFAVVLGAIKSCE